MSGGVSGAPNLTVVDAITQFVNATQTTWNSITLPVPLGLAVYATDTTVVKIGDGTSLYSALPELFTVSDLPTLVTQVAAINAALGGGGAIVTPPVGDISTKIATTAFLARAYSAGFTFTGQTGGTVTVSQGQAGFGFLSVQGTLTSDLILVFPNTGRWLVANFTTGDFKTTCTTASGSGTTVKQGRLLEILADGININPALSDFSHAPFRTQLAVDTTFYVAATGSDSTGDGTSVRPWATPTHAWTWLRNNIDAAGFNITIQADGTTYSMNTSFVGKMPGMVQPVVFSGTGPSTVLSGVSGPLASLSLYDGAEVMIANMTIINPTAAGANNQGSGIAISDSTLQIGAGVTFGAVSVAQMVAGFGAQVVPVNVYNISGGGQSHLYCTASEFIAITSGCGVDITAAVTFSQAFIIMDNSYGNANSYTITGGSNVTGQRFLVTDDGVLTTNGGGANFFPGTVAGVVDSGSKYS